MDLTCTYTNRRLPGELTWVKSDETGVPLTGSQWQLTSEAMETISISDCVSEGQCAGTGDADPKAGIFKVTGLKWGNFTLSETVSPPGYVLDSTPHSVEISADVLHKDLGQIVNKQVSVPSLPLTGGASSDAFVISGGIAALLSVVSALITRRVRSSRKGGAPDKK